MLAGAAGTLLALLPAMDSLHADFGSLPETEQATRSGKPVEVLGERTPTTEVWANPDGTFRQDISAVPTRVKVGKKWKQIDLDLVKGSDGSVRPKASANQEVLSGGGKSPLLTSTFDGVTVSTTWPEELPSPSLEGATATYPEVLPGVDLRMTVTDAGTSQVLVVRDRQAAQNPALRKLRTHTTAEGGLVRPSGKGGLSVVDRKGREVAAAQPAMMWDSRGTALDASNKELKRGTREALLARTRGPAADDSVHKVATTVTNTSVTLRPDADALTGDDVVYPVFIDPMSSPALDVWTTIRQSPETSYYKSTSVKWIGKNTSYLQRMFWKFNVSALNGAYISNARMSAKLLGTSSCTLRQAKVYRTDGINAGTTWSNQPTWYSGEYQGAQSDAVNDPDCNRYGKVMEFTVTDAIKKSSFEGWGFVTLAMRATDESNTSGYMFFDYHTTLSVTYSYRPRTPSLLSMSDPDAPCGGTIGGVKPRLTAELVDTDGENVVHHFQVFTGSSLPANPDTATKFWEETGTAQSSGDGAGPATFTTAGRVEGPPDANGERTLPNGTYTWRVQGIEASGLRLEGLWSAPCTFTVRDGLVDPPGVTGLPSTWSLDAAPVNLTLTSPPNMAPVGGQDLSYYRWSLNADSPTSLPVLPTTGTNGTAVISVKPTKAGVNVLRVWAYDNSGNRSLPFAYTFDTNGTTAAYSSRYLFNETTGSTTVADQLGQQNLTGVSATGLQPRGTYRVAGSTTDLLDNMLVRLGTEAPAQTGAVVVNTTQSFTVSAWIDPTAATAPRAAVSQGNGTNSTFTLGVAANCGATSTSSCYRFGVRTSTGMQYVDSTRDPVSDFAPGLVHVVGDVSVSATKTVARLRVVVDGQIQSKELQLTGPPVASTGTGAGLLIGAARSAGSYTDKFVGAIDDVMLKQGVLDDVGLIQLDAEDGGRCYTSGNAGGGPLCAS